MYFAENEKKMKKEKPKRSGIEEIKKNKKKDEKMEVELGTTQKIWKSEKKSQEYAFEED